MGTGFLTRLSYISHLILARNSLFAKACAHVFKQVCLISEIDVCFSFVACRPLTVTLISDSMAKHVTGIQHTTVQAFPGADISRLMYKVSKNKASIHSKHTILLIGTNDVASSKSVDEIMSLFQKLITLIRTKSSTNIIISGIIPRPCDLYKDPNETRMKDVNKELQILCRDRHVSFLHTYRIFLRNNKPIRSLFEFYDHGQNLNSEGIQRLRRFFHITVTHLQ